MSDYRTQAHTREAALVEAGGLAASGQHADARAVYLWVLARAKDDPEALFGLARVDSWGGCWKFSQEEYLQVLAAHPEDADVRAGFVDLLTWSGRLEEAQQVLGAGLAIDPKAPSLLARAARFALWKGDAQRAEDLATAAERADPADPELRELRDRLFVGESRLTARVDVYPSAYPSIYSLGAQGLQRVGRFELTAGAQVVDRIGGGYGPIVDGRYPLGVVYHPALGWTVGGELAFGAPANAIPRWTIREFVVAPLGGRFDTSMSYDLWLFDSGEHVHLFDPGIGVELPKEIRLDLRAWIAAVTIPSGTRQVVGAGGIQVGWAVAPRVDLSATATYGVEIEPTGALTQLQLLDYAGPAGGVSADWRISRHVGLKLSVGYQHLRDDAGQTLSIESVELGVYDRW
ncbi:MAG TPA: tetratricopeptide repeat protein [Polyangiaceae bacterium]|nr:tetratricopeptide repeat protein [Polyangiaceae bacterium]